MFKSGYAPGPALCLGQQKTGGGTALCSASLAERSAGVSQREGWPLLRCFDASLSQMGPIFQAHGGVVGLLWQALGAL